MTALQAEPISPEKSTSKADVFISLLADLGLIFVSRNRTRTGDAGAVSVGLGVLFVGEFVGRLVLVVPNVHHGRENVGVPEHLDTLLKSGLGIDQLSFCDVGELGGELVNAKCRRSNFLGERRTDSALEVGEGSVFVNRYFYRHKTVPMGNSHIQELERNL